MWSRFFKLVLQVFNYHEDLRTLKETAKQQALQIRALADHQKQMEHDAQLQRERDAREREQMFHQLELAFRDRLEDALRLENQQLREKLERTERLSLPLDESSKD